MPTTSESSSRHRHRHHSSSRHRLKPAEPPVRPGDDNDGLSSLSSNSPQLLMGFFNSVVLFILAYFIVDILFQIITWVVASKFGIQCRIGFNGILLNEKHKNWTPIIVLFVYVLPPFIITFLGLIWRWMINKTTIDEVIFHGVPKLLRWKNSMHENDGLGKVLYMWIFFHAFSMLFTSGAIMLFFNKGIGSLLSAIEIEMSIKFVLAVFFLFLLASIGKRNVKLVLRTSTSKKLVLPDTRKYFIIFQAILPWLVGTIIIWLTHIPEYQFNGSLVGLIAMGSVFVFMLAKPKKVVKINIYKSDKPQQYIPLLWLVALLLFIGVYRFVLPLILNQ